MWYEFRCALRKGPLVSFYADGPTEADLRRCLRKDYPEEYDTVWNAIDSIDEVRAADCIITARAIDID